MARRWKRMVFGLGGAIAVLCATPAAEGQLAAESVEPSPSSALLMVVRLEGSTLDQEAIRQAVASELGIDVVLGSAAAGPQRTLSVHVRADREATLRFRSSEGVGGRLVERRIELPGEGDRAVETIALLAGNLVRNEAAELLEELQRARAAKEAAEVPPKPNPKPKSKPRPKSKSTAKSTPKSSSKPSAKPKTGTEPSGERSPGPADDLDPWHFSLFFFHPLALPPDSDRRTVNAGLGAIYGHMGSVDGAVVSGMVLRVDGGLNGAVVSGLGTYVGANTSGALFSGLGNWSRGRLWGAQIGGLGNLNQGAVTGGQVGGLVNLSGGRLEGVQIAGLVNLVTPRLSREPSPGSGTVRGAQYAALGNIAGTVEGAQVGLANVTTGEVDGAQLGLVNYGGKVDGFQLGLVNVAEEANGLSVGVVNILGNARTQPTVWATSSVPINAGVRYLQGDFYTLVGVGMAFGRTVGESDHGVWATTFGIGAHIPFEPFFLDTDISYSHELVRKEFRDGSSEEDLHVARVRGLLGWQIVDALGIYAGAGLRQENPHGSGDATFGPEGHVGIYLL